MQKRTLQHVVIMLLLLMLTGCASIQARVSDCQRMFASTFSPNNRIPRQEREVLLTLNEMAQGRLAQPTQGAFPCNHALPPCQWPGVTCSSGHVTKLVLTAPYYQLLSGEIPPELGSLSQLQELSLYNNQLTGEIPPELGKLSQLQKLALYYNQLSGEIPPELKNLSQLEALALANNQLSGEIPSELGNLSQLWVVELDGNQLSGELPSELASLSQLERLDISNNQLSRPLPEGLTNLPIGSLYISNTDLCIPRTPEFEAWIAGIKDRDFENVPYCE